jgi:hypothetical protein
MLELINQAIAWEDASNCRGITTGNKTDLEKAKVILTAAAAANPQ